ncbi:FUSC family protein [Rhodovulum sulfidophilum]|uniref:FUSC family protein n=1 Tax=Rhodovulum sulfidophilum TaxID=35806 RepID=UPI000950C2FB|nr:FUSC family protein [Rhodovulum sulfidophilum]MBL3552584.1 FUSC family protein [Rhodovulum sulfidophilum]OLS46857.1 hypothetical protein BV379_00160 [Rhodovulum sulfidophilum]
MMIPGGIKLEHVLFSLKTFGAGMLAYWIAIRFGLSDPYWAAGTVYVIANPLAGAIASRALYRLAGTVLGAVLIVLLVPNLVFSPLLLSAAIGLTCGACLFVSMLDRSPRSYAFMLAGYTVSLTGFPLVNAPGTSFDVSVERVEEIAIGILCAAITVQVVFPWHIGPMLAKRVEGWLDNAAAMTRSVLTRNTNRAKLQDERHKLAADVISLRSFTDQVAHEGVRGWNRAERMGALQQRMIAVLPLLSEIEDLLNTLERNGPDVSGSAALTGKVLQWLDKETSATRDETDALLFDIDAEQRRLDDQPHSWEGLLRQRLTGKLRDLVEVWADCQSLRTDISSGETHELRQHLAARHRRARDLHTDYGAALRSAVSVFILIMVACAIWIWTGWTYGAGLAQFGSVFCCVLATMDNATPVLRKVAPLMLVAFVIALLYQFVFMPALGDFYALVALLGLVLIPAGVLMAVPATWMTGFQVSVNLIYMMTLGNQVSTDFTAFANASLSTFGALALATIIMSTVRAVSAEHSAMRLLRSGWRVVSQIAAGRRQVAPELIAGRMTDRLGLIVPRLTLLPPDAALLENDLLRDLRAGLCVLELRNLRPEMPDAFRLGLDRLLDQVSEHYRNDKSGPARAERESAMAGMVDECLNQALATSGTTARRFGNALAGLRSAICPGQPAPVLNFSDRGTLA